MESLGQISYVRCLLPGEATCQQLRRRQLKYSRCLELLMSLHAFQGSLCTAAKGSPQLLT